MHLQAHTNEPGVHRLFETTHYRNYGSQYNFGTHEYETFDHVSGGESIEVAVSDKIFPVQGDHKSVYPYYRYVAKVVDNDPFRIHYFHRNGIDPSIIEYDYLYDSYISYFYVPFHYNPFYDERYVHAMDNTKAEVVVKALNRLKDDKAQILADFAQSRQVVNMMSSSIIKAVRVLRAFRKGNISQVPKILGLSKSSLRQNRGRSLADYWLEYSYGWKPLADDIYTTQKILLNQLEKGRKLKSSAKASFKDAFTGVDGSRRNDIELEASLRATIHAEIENPYLSTIDQLGLSSPAQVAWELVPWSFAVDWIVPIGSTLEALTAAVGLKFRSGWISSHQSFSVNSRFYQDLTDDPWATLLVSGHYSEKSYYFNRYVMDDFPSPQLYVDWTPYSTPRALNALALVRQL